MYFRLILTILSGGGGGVSIQIWSSRHQGGGGGVKPTRQRGWNTIQSNNLIFLNSVPLVASPSSE